MVMRTTLDLEEDVLLAAKDIAERERLSMGRVLSRLARAALSREVANDEVKNGVRVFRPKESSPVLTLELVNRLRDEE